MRILHINTTDSGGAANACIRLHEGLINQGIYSEILCLHKTKSSERKSIRKYHSDRNPSFWSKFKTRLEGTIEYRLNLKSRRKLQWIQFLLENQKRDKRLEMFSYPTTDFDITGTDEYKLADIIHLHWVSGFIDFGTFFRKNYKPVVWTLHDMYPFTGGEHYLETHLGIDENGLPIKRDFEKSFITQSKKQFNILKSAYKHLNCTVVSPSAWMFNLAKNSELLNNQKHIQIPNPFNTSNFYPLKNNRPRANYTKLFFVADQIHTYRKGFLFLTLAIQQLLQENYEIILTCIGSGEIMDENINFLGKIDNIEQLRDLYNDNDLYVIPSVMDNLPNTMIESLLCGTPVVGFPVGGIHDTIIEEFNGIIAEEISVNSLAKAIKKAIKFKYGFDRLSIAKNANERFNQKLISEKYIDIYNKLLS